MAHSFLETNNFEPVKVGIGYENNLILITTSENYGGAARDVDL